MFNQYSNKWFRRSRQNTSLSRFRPFAEALEQRVLLTCGLKPNSYLLQDDFNDAILAANTLGVGSGWTTATFGGGGAETDSAFRFDGRSLLDWNLAEISSFESFDVWNNKPLHFEFQTGNAQVTVDSPFPTALRQDFDLLHQFGVVSGNERKSGSGGDPTTNEANLYQNTDGGLYVELFYERDAGDRDLSVAGQIRVANQNKIAWTGADSDAGIFTPVSFTFDNYDGQRQLITTISVGPEGWTIEFSEDISPLWISGEINIDDNTIHGSWKEDSLDDAFITDEFLEGVYPFAMGQNVFSGRGSVDLLEVNVCRPDLDDPAPDETEPNNDWTSSFDLGHDDQVLTNLSLHALGDVDWFSWTASYDGLLSVNLYSDATHGDIDLSLYSADGDLLDISATDDDHEGIYRQVRAGESYLFRVEGLAGATQSDYEIATGNNPSIGELIYVAVGHEIRVFDSKGTQVNTFHDPLLKSGQVSDVEIGPDGFIYVSVDIGADAGADGKIVQFSPNGKRLGEFSLPKDPFTRNARSPYGFDVLNDGTFLIALPNLGHIVQMSRKGKIIKTFVVGPSMPSDVTSRSTGELVFADDKKGESMINSIPGGKIWIAERGKNKTTLRDTAGTVLATRKGTRPIDAEQNQNGTLYITELTELSPFAVGSLKALDKNGATVFSSTIHGMPLGLAVSKGYTTIQPTNLIDSDEDGLPDIWEKQGIDIDGQGIDLDLPKLGADPNHKDLFVEIDAMQGRVPNANAIKRVIDAFKAVPNSLVNNPDKKDGINLHVILDDTNIPLSDFTPAGKNLTWQQINANAWQQFDPIKMKFFGTKKERGMTNWLAIRKAKQLVYRYGLFADNYNPNGSTGIAELPGDDFIVTLGSAPTPGGNEDQQAATFMHEFGHTLGLKHGGSDNINFKPNYHSVMNYHWQFPGSYGNVGWTLDFSRKALPTLNEKNLDEASGIGFPAKSIHDTASHKIMIGPWKPDPVDEVGPVDFSDGDADKDGDPNNDKGVKRDLNSGFRDTNGDRKINQLDAAKDSSPGQLLHGYNDWANLKYDLGNHHNFKPGLHQSPPLFEQVSDPIIVTNLLGDVNRDEVVNAADIDDIYAAVEQQKTDLLYDLDDNKIVDRRDLIHLIDKILKSLYGDSNLDGIFNSQDLVQIFQSGQYEDGKTRNSGWDTGDWNGDQEFDSSDLVLAFQQGGYTSAAKGPFVATAAALDSLQDDSPRSKAKFSGKLT